MRRATEVVALVAALSVTAVPCAYAAEEPLDIENIEELDLASLLGTVTAVSRREESVFTAPATVTVLDQADLRASGATNIADLLRRVPGVQVVESAPGDYLVSLRGTGGVTGNNVIVLIDGIPINSRIDGSVDWGGLPVDAHQLDRIEIVRGPVSTIYGANAYTGVINIVTLTPSSGDARGTALAQGGVDLQGHLLGGASAGVSATRGPVTVRLSGTGTYDQLFADGSSATQPALRKLGGMSILRAALGPRTTLTLEIAGDWHEGSSLDHLVLESHPQSTAFAFGTLRLDARDLPSVLDTVSLWTRGKLLSISTDPTLYTGFANNGASALDGEAGADVAFDLPLGVRAGIGANAGSSRVSAPFIHPAENAQLRGNYGFYGSVGADLWKRLSLLGAVRGDISALTSGLAFSYRASAIYHGKQASLRLTAGSAYREPTYVEVAGRFIDPRSMLILLEGTPGLAPPRVDSIELALIVVTQRITLKPTVYLERLSNLMVEDFADLTRHTFRNDPNQYLVLGGELEAELHISRALGFEGSLSGLYFLTDVTGALPTLGVPAQNSLVVAWLGGRGRLLDDRVGWGVGVSYVAPRSYDLRAGIPPALLALDVPSSFRLDASVDLQPTQRTPFRFFVRLLSSVPAVVESSFPGAGRSSTSLTFGVEYRGE